MRKYEIKNIAQIKISNDGRGIDVDIDADNRGDTRVTFGSSYTLRVDAADLEELIEGLQGAYEMHKTQAIAEYQAQNQESLPFSEEVDVRWPLNDPRKW